MAFRTDNSGSSDVTVQTTSTISTSAATTATTSTTSTTATTTTTTTNAVKRPPASEKVRLGKTIQAAAQPETRKYSLYSVKIAGLDGSKSVAERIHAKLRQAGYSSELIKDIGAGGRAAAHNVYVGHFRSQADAEAFRKLLWKNEGVKGSVAGRE
jgi:cell division septation protein DedD